MTRSEHKKEIKCFFDELLYEHQKKSLESSSKERKCLINMWCGTGKTRTFTISILKEQKPINVIVFPSLGLINQYNNDYFLEKPFCNFFQEYKCLSFCSDDEKKLKKKKMGNKIKYSTNEKTLKKYLTAKNKKKLFLVTYQSFEKFTNVCIEQKIKINQLIYDEAHHIVGDHIKDIVFSNKDFDDLVEKTRFYTATPVNRNGITMYDREDEELSDCGPLVYEYLYYQAVKDKICKPFISNISLYCQLSEYKSPYQPHFEMIIRACLSGEYKYWNILSYHRFVNETENVANQDGVSFVNDFASKKNKELFKNIFKRIQQDEFQNTIDDFKIENVHLEGVHSKSRNREAILDKFDKKDHGRIFLLASCGILNEGIDTKWANMAVPINPSQSIVKESQRIGRLVRVPEKNMPDAIMLIPCLVDIGKYKTMDTSEKKDELIRAELSESGNFNTALNVMSAFQYQYDPELYELCLAYPNCYAPKEVKDNLEKQNLKVDDSQGDLRANLKYVIENDDTITDEIKLEDNINDDELLECVSNQLNKTIEIHTQNYEEPIIYVNKECPDEFPIRLFHNKDDDTYSPILPTTFEKKVKKTKVKSPTKRKPIFNIHVHKDLNVFWDISNVKLNGTFGQGVLNANIKWNVKNWYDSLEKVKTFIDTHEDTKPRGQGKKAEESEKQLGKWICTQTQNYKNNKQIMKTNKEVREKWEEFISDDKYSKHFVSDEEKWYDSLEKVKTFIDTHDDTKPRGQGKKVEESEKQLGYWISHQKQNYKNNKYIMRTNKEVRQKWEAFISDDKYSKHFKSKQNKKNMSKPVVSVSKTTNPTGLPRPKSELSDLHQKYKTMTSQNLHNLFKNDKKKWEEYHSISKSNEETFPTDSIPRNVIINYLENNIPSENPKVVADLGCGYAEISQHFKDSKKFTFHNFDHVSTSEFVEERDIENTKLKDYSVNIVILSLAMWGSNCKNYLTEAYRILDEGGTLLIIEPSKRWISNDDKNENRMKLWLEESKFNILDYEEEKFMFIKARKD